MRSEVAFRWGLSSEATIREESPRVKIIFEIPPKSSTLKPFMFFPPITDFKNICAPLPAGDQIHFQSSHTYTELCTAFSHPFYALLKFERRCDGRRMKKTVCMQTPGLWNHPAFKRWATPLCEGRMVRLLECSCLPAGFTLFGYDNKSLQTSYMLMDLFDVLRINWNSGRPLPWERSLRIVM